MQLQTVKAVSFVCLSLALGAIHIPAQASDIVIRKGTDVTLAFASAMSSRTAKPGDKVQFRVMKDVQVDDSTVIKEGAPVTGTIVKVNKRGRFGVNARVQLKMASVKSVSGRMVPLGFKTKGEAVGSRTGEATGASVGSALILGPLGLAAGYFVVGKTVNAKPGDKMTVEVSQDTYVKKTKK